MEILCMRTFVAFLIAYLSIMVMVYMIYDPLPGLQKMSLTIPLSHEALPNISRYLREYKEKHPYLLIFIYSNVSLAVQLLWLPGSRIIDMIGGAVWGYYVLPLVCLLKSIGAALVYYISSIKLRRFVNDSEFESINNHIAQIDENGLYLILLTLRLTPYASNWLMNILFPCFGIPFRLFIVSHFFGSLPYTFMYVQLGVALEVKLTWATFLLIQLVPTLVAFHIYTLYPKVAIIIARARHNALHNRFGEDSDLEDQ